MGERSCSRKNRSRNEVFSMLMFPVKSLAARKPERNWTSSKVATSFKFSSRNWKRPCIKLTRRTSGVNAGTSSLSSGCTEIDAPGVMLAVGDVGGVLVGAGTVVDATVGETADWLPWLGTGRVV